MCLKGQRSKSEVETHQVFQFSWFIYVLFIGGAYATFRSASPTPPKNG